MPEEKQITIQAETPEEYNERVKAVHATGIFLGPPTFAETDERPAGAPEDYSGTLTPENDPVFDTQVRSLYGPSEAEEQAVAADTSEEESSVEDLRGEELERAVQEHDIDTTTGGSLADGSLSADEKRAAVAEAQAGQSETQADQAVADEPAETADPVAAEAGVDTALQQQARGEGEAETAGLSTSTGAAGAEEAGVTEETAEEPADEAAGESASEDSETE